MRFFDASALVKRYVRERGTRRVETLLRAGEAVVSRLSAVEVASALACLTRDGSLSRTARDRALSELTQDLLAWHVVELTTVVVFRAQRALVRHPLRAGDAIQLAAALTFAEAFARPLRGFVVADARLATAADAEGLTVEVV